MRLSLFLIIAISGWTLFHSFSSAQSIPGSDPDSTGGILIICGEGLLPSYDDPKTLEFAMSTSTTFAETLRSNLKKDGISAEVYVHRDKSLNVMKKVDSLLLETKRDSMIQVVFGHQKKTSEDKPPRNLLYLDVSYMKLIYSSDQGRKTIKIDHGPKKRFLLAGGKKTALSHYADDFTKTLQQGGYISRSAFAQSEPKITNYQTEGNLESTLTVDCADITTLNNKYTPADLYKGVAKCVNEQNYRAGGELFALAGTYGRFDAKRVVDKTAHQAVQALILQNVFPLEEKKRMAFFSAFKSDMVKGSESLKATCSKIRKIGPPTYYPKYMIQHGMGASMGELRDKVGVRGKDPSSALQVNFDAENAWNSVLRDYLHCPEM